MMMKLRFRSLQSKETRKLEVPNEFSIQQLKEFLSISLSSTPSSLRLSLNGKDELSSPCPGDSLLSIGITSGDLIYYYDFSSLSTQQGNIPSNLQDCNSRDPIIDANVKPFENSEQSDVRDKGKEIVMEDEDMVDGESFDFDARCEGKRLSEPYFLKRVLCEDMGDDFSDTKLVFLAIHAVFLESGFVGFDSMSGLRVDLFDIMKEQASVTQTTSVSYTLPELLSDDDNDTESIVLKFQTLGHYVNVYGSLAKGRSGLHKLNIDKSRCVRAIGTFWGTGDDRDRLNEIDSDIAYAEKVVFDFWKFVKDGLALPLLIDLCEKTGLELPPCLIRLPADLKFRILELLPGQDVTRVACVCKEMSYLSTNNELWKAKYISEFGSGTGEVLSHTSNWKARFASSWENTKKRKRGVRLIRPANPLGPIPFGVPLPLPGHGPYPFGIRNNRLVGGPLTAQQRQYALLQMQRNYNRGVFMA